MITKDLDGGYWVITVIQIFLLFEVLEWIFAIQSKLHSRRNQCILVIHSIVEQNHHGVEKIITNPVNREIGTRNYVWTRYWTLWSYCGNRRWFSNPELSSKRSQKRWKGKITRNLGVLWPKIIQQVKKIIAAQLSSDSEYEGRFPVGLSWCGPSQPLLASEKPSPAAQTGPILLLTTRNRIKMIQTVASWPFVAPWLK